VFADYVVFGKPAVLSCVYDDNTSCVLNQTRMWYRGESLSTLLLNGIPAKHDDRYSEDILSCSEFHLKISNFSEKDLNDEYACSVGFQICRLTFNISHSNYECKYILFSYLLIT
jgi:hypothetical protein